MSYGEIASCEIDIPVQEIMSGLMFSWIATRQRRLWEPPRRQPDAAPAFQSCRISSLHPPDPKKQKHSRKF